MDGLPYDLRLAWAIGLALVLAASCWRFVARRSSADWSDRAADVALLFLLTQYASVTLPGIAGVLSLLTISLVTLVISATLAFFPGRRSDQIGAATPALPIRNSLTDRWLLRLCPLFALGYFGAMMDHQSLAPVLANDALTYHFPAAVKWLQTGRLALLETWFFNPANTYSPLAGSTFIAWWIAPMGCDVLAKYVQCFAVPLIYFGILRLCRDLGARAGVAALIALAAVLSQPIARQAIIEKDDLYLAGFFLAAAAACSQQRLRDSLGPWRLGTAVGLMLATKYTALLAAPMLLLAIEAPIRARWPIRRWPIAAGIAILLAGPWYLRNALLTGNPLYPADIRIGGFTLFPGLFSTQRSDHLLSAGSVWQLLTARDQSLPWPPLVILLLGWIIALVSYWQRLRSNPLLRLVLLGPPAGLLLFLLASPYDEVRFLFPAILLLFASAGATLQRWPILQWAGAALILLLAGSTGLAPRWLAQFAPVGAALAVLAGLFSATLDLRPRWRTHATMYGPIAIALTTAMILYTRGKAYVADFIELTPISWKAHYGKLAELWEFAATGLPPREPLAYSNTFLLHPLFGPDHARPLLYVPTRKGVKHLHDLPNMAGPLPGERIVEAVAQSTAADPDGELWLKRLDASGATHLLVACDGPIKNPPELQFIANHPGRFEKVIENESGIIFRLRK